MPDLVTGLTHQDAQKKDDAVLRKEARAYLEQTPAAQIVAEVLTRLRSIGPPWWSPETLRARWSATERMRWYRQRVDLRQEITTSLTGLAPRAARRKDPDFQAGLIDSVIEEGDIDVARFEEAFDPTDIAVYGPPGDAWRHLYDRFPWDDDAQENQDLCAWMLRVLLADRCALHGIARKPVLGAWELRTAIEGKVWHARMPLEIRVAIDDARLRQERERPTDPFHAKGDLAIAVPELIAANIPLRDLLPVFEAAGRALGVSRKPPEEVQPRPAPPKGAVPVPAPTPSVPTLTSAEVSVKTVQTPSTPPASTSPATSRNPAPSPKADSRAPEKGQRAASFTLGSPQVPLSPPDPATSDPQTDPNMSAPTPLVGVPAAKLADGAPAEEEDLEQTNPWVVPSVDELWTGEGIQPFRGEPAPEPVPPKPEASSTSKRRRK